MAAPLLRASGFAAIKVAPPPRVPPPPPPKPVAVSSSPTIFSTVGAAGKAVASTAKVVASQPPAKIAETVVGLPKPKTQTEHAAYLNKVVDDVHAGAYDEGTGAVVLKQAGFPDRDNPFAQSHGLPGVVQGLKTALTPRRSGVLAAQDLARGAERPNAGFVGFGPGAAFGFGRQLAYQAGQNLTYAPGGVAAFVENPGRTAGELLHNLENPNPVDAAIYGYLALHGGAAGISRGLAAGRALRAGEGLGTAVTRSSAEGGSLLHTPAGSPVRIYVPHTRDTVLEPAAEPVTPHVSHGQEFAGSLPDQARQPGYVYHRAPASSLGSIRERGLHPSKPAGPNPRGVYFADEPLQAQGLSWKRGGIYLRAKIESVPGLQRRSFGESVSSTSVPAADLEYLGADGAWHPVRAPVAREVPMVGPVNATVVERPIPRAALARPLARARGKIIQRAVDREARAPGVPVGAGRRLGAKLNMRVAQTVSSRKTVAREIRAGRRTDLALANSTPVALDHALAKLSPAEHEAITIASIAGDEAATNPAAAAARQIAAHEHFAALGGDVAQNERAINDIRAAQTELENPSPKLQKALALAKEESQRQEQALIDAGHITPEQAQGRLDNAARVYGYDEAPPGAFFTSQSTSYLPADMPGPTAGVRPGPSAVPPPQAGTRVPGLNQTFTGESLASGYRAGPSVIARRGVLVNRLLSVERQYQDLWKIASPQRMSVYDIGVRDTPQIRQELRDFFNEIHDRLHVNPEASGTLTAEQVKRVAELLQLRDPSQMAARVGSEIPGVRWVDSRYLADLGGTLNGVGIYRLADAINNPVRFFQLYLRPAYVMNLAGNLGMNGITEGVRVFPALRSAAASNRLYGDSLTRWIDGGMGVSLSRSYSVGRGFLGHQSDRIAEVWNGITDMHSRRGAFFGEAARNGIRTRQQLEALKAAKPGSALAAKRTLIFRAANKNIVDFGSLTPVEQNEVRRLIYFYPWVSRGTMWALRALVEHPAKSFTLYELGKIGAANAHKAFGQHLAQWFNQIGATPIGAQHGDIRNAANFSSINTFQTAVGAAHTLSDTAKGLAGLPQGGALGQALTPGATAFMQAGTANPTGSGQTGIPGLIEQQPIYALLHRFGLVGKPSKTHPVTGIEQALLPFAIGGAYPQPTSHSALAKGAVKEARTSAGKLGIELDQLAEEGVISQSAADTAKEHLHALPAKGITYIRNEFGPKLDLAQKIDQWVSAGKITDAQAAKVKATIGGMSRKDVDNLRKALAVGLGQKPAPGPVPVG